MIIGNKIGNKALVTRDWKSKDHRFCPSDTLGQFLVMIVDSDRLFPVVFATMTVSDDE